MAFSRAPHKVRLPDQHFPRAILTSFRPPKVLQSKMSGSYVFLGKTPTPFQTRAHRCSPTLLKIRLHWMSPTPIVLFTTNSKQIDIIYLISFIPQKYIALPSKNFSVGAFSWELLLSFSDFFENALNCFTLNRRFIFKKWVKISRNNLP